MLGDTLSRTADRTFSSFGVLSKHSKKLSAEHDPLKLFTDILVNSQIIEFMLKWLACYPCLSALQNMSIHRYINEGVIFCHKIYFYLRPN